MDRGLNIDCWLHVLDYLRSDRHALSQLLMVDKAMFQAVAPILYHRPQIDFELNDESKTALLELLRKKNATPPVCSSDQISTEASPTIDYYSLVHEMSSPLRDPTPGSLVDSKERTEECLASYFRDFGSKIKEISVSVKRMKTFQDHFKNLSQLDTILFIEENFDNEVKDDFLKVIETHRSLFPGMLKNVSYLHYKSSYLSSNDSYRDYIATDTTMMLKIRNIMDGQWSLDSVQFLISSEEDEDLLQVLEDPDLPKQINSVKIFESIDDISNRWDQPLKVFLSRCRVMDRVDFEDFYRPELLSWVFEEKAEQQQQQPKVVAGDVLLTRSPVQWKSVSVDIYWAEWEEDWIVRLAETFQKFWNCIVIGLGHCLEELKFSVEVPVECEDSFPVLSLPGTINLPKLQNLFIVYPKFSKLAYKGIEYLRDLTLYVENVHVDDDDQWQDWRNWKSVESLNVQYQGDTGIFGQWPLHRLGVEELKVNTEVECKRPDNQTLNAVQLSDMFILPALKEVWVTDYTTNRKQLYWLIIAPNLSRLVVQITDLNTLELLVKFFKEADDRSLVFPSLKKINLSPFTINDENAVYISRLIGLTPGIDMFPALEDIRVGYRKCNHPRSYFREQSGHTYSDLKDIVIAAFPPSMMK